MSRSRQSLVTVKRPSSLKTTVKSLHHKGPSVPPIHHHLSFSTSPAHPRPASSAPPSSLWVTSPPFSKPFSECAGMNPVRNQTKGHPLRTNPDPAPEAKTQVIGCLPSDSTSLLRISSSKKSCRLGGQIGGRTVPRTDHLRVWYPCCFVQLAEMRLLRPCLRYCLCGGSV